MEITISGRSKKVTPEMKRYADDKMMKLEKYFDRLGQVDVALGCEGEGFSAEIVASAKRGKRLVAQASEEDMFAAIDIVVDKMERQLTKHKEKLKSHRLRAVKELAVEEKPSSAAAPSYDEDEDEGPEAYY